MKHMLDITLIGKSYPVCITEGELASVGEYIRELLPEAWKSFVISDQTTFRLYGEKLIDILFESGLNPSYTIVPDGEQSKSLKMSTQLYEELNKHGVDRKSVIISLGGGMIGDLAGFVAASYMRGIPFVQIPTTLLAQADSSIGGKVAVNHLVCKNMIGFFYQPDMVFTDVNVLKTLPQREFNSGVAEIIGHGMILDENYFSWIENNLDMIKQLNSETLIRLIYGSCRIKKSVVESDEHDNGYRAILNFGHTIGHALETITEYKRYQHGEAVAIGMAQVSLFAESMGLISRHDVNRLINLIKRFDMPVELPSDINAYTILEAMKMDKKSINHKAKLIMPTRVGEVQIVSDWKERDLIRVLEGS